MAEVQTNSRRSRRCFCLVGIDYRYNWGLLVQTNVSEIGTTGKIDLAKTAIRYMSEMHERKTKKHMWGKVGVYQ